MEIEKKVRQAVRDVLSQANLDELTTRKVRNAVEEKIGIPVVPYKAQISAEIESFLAKRAPGIPAPAPAPESSAMPVIQSRPPKPEAVSDRVQVVCKSMHGWFLLDENMIETEHGVKMSPSQFEVKAGSGSKKWKDSVRVLATNQKIGDFLSAAPGGTKPAPKAPKPKPAKLDPAPKKSAFIMDSVQPKKRRKKEEVLVVAEPEPEPSPEGSESGDEEEYEVDRVVARRLFDDTVKYLIKWKNYSEADNTWEPEENLNCPDTLALYDHRLPKPDQFAAKERALVEQLGGESWSGYAAWKAMSASLHNTFAKLKKANSIQDKRGSNRVLKSSSVLREANDCLRRSSVNQKQLKLAIDPTSDL